MAATPSAPPPVLPVEQAVEYAAETGHVPANAAAAAAEHDAGGLPQFEFQHWAGQVVYLLILFVVLYLLIAKVFAPRLRRVIDERADTMSTAVATARSVQTEAAAQADAARAEVEKARADARAASIAAKARVTAEIQARQAEDEAAVAARIATAEAGIAATRDAALAHAGAIAADTTRAIVERLTGQAPSADEAAAAVKGAA